MKLRFRYYLWPENDEPLRLTVAFLEGKTSLPQYAGQRMKELIVYYTDDEIIEVIGAYITFDSDGHHDRFAAVVSGFAQVEAYDAKRHALRAKVPDIGKVRGAIRKAATHRWQPTDTDIERVIAELYGKTPIKIAKQAIARLEAVK